MTQNVGRGRTFLLLALVAAVTPASMRVPEVGSFGGTEGTVMASVAGVEATGSPR